MNKIKVGDRQHFRPVPSLQNIRDLRVSIHVIKDGYGKLKGFDLMICGPDNPGLSSPPRHGKLYNAFFCDGHIAGLKPDLVFNLTNSAAEWNYDHQPHSETWIRQYGP